MTSGKLILRICGMACMGKSYSLSLLSSKYNILGTDFYENVERCPLFRLKHDIKVIQIIYSIYMSTIHLYPSNSDPSKFTLQDRCCFSDLFYQTVYDEMTRKNSGLPRLDMIFNNKLLREEFEKYHILFILSSPDSHEKVLDRMKMRQNDIDRLSIDYVQAQYLVFSHLKQYKIPSFYFLELPKEALYTKQGSELITNKIVSIEKQMSGA